jgi:hypothetical protein
MSLATPCGIARAITRAIDWVAERLNNTRSVCRRRGPPPRIRATRALHGDTPQASVQVEQQLLERLEADRPLHPRVGDDDEEVREPGPQEEQHRRRPVQHRAHAVLARCGSPATPTAAPHG